MAPLNKDAVLNRLLDPIKGVFESFSIDATRAGGLSPKELAQMSPALVKATGNLLVDISQLLKEGVEESLVEPLEGLQNSIIALIEQPVSGLTVDELRNRFRNIVVDFISKMEREESEQATLLRKVGA